MNYKRSKFNYVVERKNCFLVYNTLYSSLTRLGREEYLMFENLDKCSDELLYDFIQQGMVVDNSVDELGLYNIYIKLASKYYFTKPNITITPTMECNARCFYCYEEGVRHGKMKNEHISRLVKMIKKIRIDKGINITWFGGEPLLNQEWIDKFSETLNNENIKFSSFMISNGSKIDQDVISKMKSKWNINSVQITFDGSCDEYATRKSYIDQDNKKIYYEMLQRIKMLSENEIAVQIRLNIDKKNIESILEVANDIQYLFADNNMVSYYPAFLTGSGDEDKLSENEKVKVVKNLLLDDKNKKIPVSRYLYKRPKAGACFYNQIGAISIDTAGNIYNCERKLGRSECAISNIYDDYTLENDIRELAGTRKECQDCVFLPKCLGGCNDAYENKECPCFIDKYIIKAYLDIL